MRLNTITIVYFLSLVLLLNCTTEKNITADEKPLRTLVFITDCAAESDFVIRILGRIRSEFPDVLVEYIQTRPFSIKESAYILQVAAESYPAGTFFTAIVEPGATDTRMVFEGAAQKKFLLPDNGLASRLLHSMSSGAIYRVENASVLNGKNIETVTSEELYSEATCSMLAGIPMKDFGDQLENPVVWTIQDPTRIGDAVYGEILFSDNFGNCVTSIPDSLMQDFTEGSLLRINVGADSFLTTLGTSYASVPMGENVAFFNTSRRLEMAVNYGDMAQRYQISAGTAVRLQPGTAHIGILRYNNSTISGAIVDDMKARLEELGFQQGNNTAYVERNAQGDLTALPQLLDELLAADLDILVPVSTPASQVSVLSAPPAVPIVFTYVTDPTSAGILDQRAHVTGLSDGPNYHQYLQFVKQLFPDMKTAGRIYSDNEANARYAQNQLQLFASSFGLEFKTATVQAVEDVLNAYQQIQNQGIEAILIIDDNTMSLSMPSLVSLAIADNLPIVGQASDHVRDGALASVSVDNGKLATKTAEVVVSVLRGVDPDIIPVQRFDTDVIAVNTETAKALDYTFPAEVLAAAKYVYP